MSSFSREKILLEAWKIVKTNLSFFVGFVLFISLINIAPEILMRRYSNVLSVNKNLSLFVQVVLFIIQLIVGYLIVKIPLLAMDKMDINKDNILSSSRTFYNYTIGSAVYGLGIILLLRMMNSIGPAGIILVFPLIFLILKFQFVNFIIIDKNISVLSAFRISNEITKDELLELFLFLLLIFLLNLLGAFVFLVGLLLTLPISILAIALIYRELIKKVSFESEV